MMTPDILNLLLGGSLVAAITALLTMRYTVAKAKAEAARCEAEAETVRMDNTEHATRILVENIVNPLRNELDENRRYLEAAKREMARLRKAIDRANSCRHSDDCPVLSGMRNQADEQQREPQRHRRDNRKPEDDDRQHEQDDDPAADDAGG